MTVGLEILITSSVTQVSLIRHHLGKSRDDVITDSSLCYGGLYPILSVIGRASEIGSVFPCSPVSSLIVYFRHYSYPHCLIGYLRHHSSPDCSIGSFRHYMSSSVSVTPRARVFPSLLALGCFRHYSDSGVSVSVRPSGWRGLFVTGLSVAEKLRDCLSKLSTITPSSPS